MATDLELKVKVDSSQVDQAAKKVETTKKLFESSPITIKYDADNKPIEAFIDKEVNLKQQTKLLYAELQKLTLAGKEQTAEFRLLSAQYNDSKDQLDKVNAKSRDLFASLALIPGPIGDIAGKLNGAIGALKTFTSFSLKDIGNQFKELNNDLNDIVKNLFGVGSSANKAKAEVADTVTTAANTVAETANTKATGDNSKAQIINAETKGLDVIATKKATLTTLENTLAEIDNTLSIERATLAKNKDLMAQYNAIVATEGGTNAALEQKIATDLETASLRVNTLEKEKEAATTEISTVKTQIDTLTKEANTTATWNLNAAIKALASSVLFWVTVIAAAAYGAYKYLSAQEQLTKAEQQNLELQKKTIETGQANISLLQNLIVTVNKSGLTQREKNKAVNEYNEKLGETLGKVKTYEELEKKLITNGPNYIEYLGIKAKAEAAYALSIEKTKEALLKGAEDPTANATFWDRLSGIVESKNYAKTVREQGAINRDAQKKELEKTSTDYFNLYTGFQQQANALAEKLKLPVPEIKTDDKKPEVKQLQDKELIEREKRLSDDLIAAKKTSDKEKEIAALEAQKKQEEREIKALYISKENEKVRTKALLELEEKFQIEKGKIVKKYDDEDEKKRKEREKLEQDAHQKLVDIGIAGVKDEAQRTRAERINKFNQEVKELDKLFADKLISQEEYNKAYKNLQKGLDNDLDKMAKEREVKELTAKKAIDESRLKLLQEGTQAYYDQQRQVEMDNYALQKAAAKDNATELERIEKEHADTMIAIGKAERDGKLALLMDHLDTVGNIGASLQKIAGKNKDLAKAGIRVEQAVTTAKIVLNDLAAIRKSYEASPLTFGLPWSAVYAVDMGLGVLAANTSANNAISALDSAGSGGGGGGDTINRGKNYGDGGMINGPSHANGGVPIVAEGGEAVMTKGAVTAFRPLLSVLNQMGGGTGFSNGVLGQAPYDTPATVNVPLEPQIIKTYIVEQDLTTIQEKQARLKSLSTL